MPVPPPLMIAPNTRRINVYLSLAVLAAGLSAIGLWTPAGRSALTGNDLLGIVVLIVFLLLMLWTATSLWLLRRKSYGLRIDQKGIHVPGFKLRWDLIQRLRYLPTDQLGASATWRIGIKLKQDGLRTAMMGALGWSAWMGINPFIKAARTAHQEDDLMLLTSGLEVGPATIRQLDQTLSQWTAQYGIERVQAEPDIRLIARLKHWQQSGPWARPLHYIAIAVVLLGGLWLVYWLSGS